MDQILLKPLRRRLVLAVFAVLHRCTGQVKSVKGLHSSLHVTARTISAAQTSLADRAILRPILASLKRTSIRRCTI